MLPVLFEWNEFSLASWHVFYVLGALSAYLMMQHLARRLPAADFVSPRHLSNLYLLGYVAGYFGARLLSVIIDQPDVIGIKATILELARIGPMTFYGGAIGSFLGCWIYQMSYRLPFGSLSDICLPAGILALGIGRIGCFLNGDDYGVAVGPVGSVGPWWSVRFPNHEDLVPRVPIQIIEAGFCFLLVVVSVCFFSTIRSKWRSGAVGTLVILGYAIFRFFAEMFRGDDRGWIIVGWVSPSQAISLTLIWVVLLLAVIRELQSKISSP